MLEDTISQVFVASLLRGKQSPRDCRFLRLLPSIAVQFQIVDVLDLIQPTISAHEDHPAGAGFKVRLQRLFEQFFSLVAHPQFALQLSSTFNGSHLRITASPHSALSSSWLPPSGPVCNRSMGISESGILARVRLSMRMIRPSTSESVSRGVSIRMLRPVWVPVSAAPLSLHFRGGHCLRAGRPTWGPYGQPSLNHDGQN